MESVTLKEVKNTVGKLADIIIENEVYFCELDSPAGDGDFGMSLSKGFRQLKAEWDCIPDDDIGAFLKGSGMIITEHCGGASGPIWGSAFRASAKYSEGKAALNAVEVAALFQACAAGIQKRGGASLGDKTLLDALIPAAEGMRLNAGKGLFPMLRAGATAAAKGADKTKEIVASKGRASYVGERSLGHPDAGAMAVSIIFKSLME